MSHSYLNSSRSVKIGARPTRERNTDEQWKILSNGITQIYCKNALQLSFEELYRNAYSMCLQKAGERLYKGTQTLISEFLEKAVAQNVVPAFPHNATPSQSKAHVFLNQVKSLWDDHIVCLGMIRDILMYLDRTYVKSANLPTVYEMGLETFRNVVLQSVQYQVKSHIITTLLYQIQLERDGQMIDRMLLKNIIDMLLTLPASSTSSSRTIATVYHADFERAFLQTSQTFYSRESEVLLKECDAIQFLKRVEKRLNEEDIRTKHYIHASTRPKIQSIFEKELLENNIKTILEMDSGLVPIVANDRFEDLQRIYSLFSRVPNGHVELRFGLSNIIKQSSITINQIHSCGGLLPLSTDTSRPSNTNMPSETNPLSPILWVEAMISLKDKYDTMLDACFARDKTFQNDINSSLETCINLNIKCPEFLSLFIDENLRKGIKGKLDDEIEKFLEKSVCFFRFIREKDVFERYYNQHLAKRLLYGRSVSHDTEKNMISKLKVECGHQFISKLEGMFKDMHVSNDLTHGFKDYMASVSVCETKTPDLSIYVLTNTFWPVTVPPAMMACYLPPSLAITVDHFQKYYMTLHSGRQLTWLKHMGTADLKAQFTTCKKELNVSTYAMVILLTLFNSLEVNEPIGYQRIMNETEIPSGDLARTLQSLSLGKYRILLKSTKTKSIGLDDTFVVNAAFTSPLSKIKIQTVAASTVAGSTTHTGLDPTSLATSSTAANSVETEFERVKTMEQVAQDRKHQIEACIVRVMKSRKSMRHNELVAMVISQLSLRFSPDPLVIKTRIEELFEREYLERDTENRQLYHYVA
ncbi:hypothetical protein BDV3_002271 [Batrachochytrium dendrobatidis]|uniref:Cullin family profile domain-containing protein n=1 Tax=Batrachochytrium dendrobatidis (strain JEL423) TaxID=403673 RepID=A0A177WY43_BATDL|nr:hypothetical protein O5D80_001267 [Batrachochytrium dendrobatidis]OAJ44545.1 hypothetical protein BDEG_27765 [Batrachochytrium dendrobatidis JEL423]